MKPSITFFPNELKTNPKSGKTPIYMRICFRRNKAECRLNVDILPTELEQWDPITMRMKVRNSALNHYLGTFEKRFHDFIILNPITLPDYSPAAIRDYVLGSKGSQRITVEGFIDGYFEKAVLNNVNRAPGTIKTYRRAINHLKKFLTITKRKSLLLEEVDFQFASDFNYYLLTTDIIHQRVGMTEVSAAGVIKKFRTMFSHAMDQDFVKRNPFKLIKIKTKSPRRERLTVEQVAKMYAANLEMFPNLNIYRDIFLFSVFTGLAYHDSISLSWADLEQRTDGNIKLKVSRQKTDVLTECFLPIQAIRIINRYKGVEGLRGLNKILPYRSNKEVNCKLKMIAQLAGIPLNLTSHISRHTYRQLLAEAGIFDTGIIKRMMGQSRNGDVDEVYYVITESRLLHAKEEFENFLTNNLPNG